MKIMIGADLVPTPTNIELFKQGDAKTIVGERFLKVMQDCDYRIFNLELALTDKETPIVKAGPNIGAPTECINGYKALGVDFLGVSNNHVLDHGYEGFVSTMKTLDDAGIAHCGCGINKEEASKPYIFEKDGIKVGIYACCEHEFSWVEDYGFGANGFDALESLDHITELKKQVDYCIVLYHGGKEHYQYPSPYLHKVCRKIVEKGADIVLCQHTHCVGTEMDYAGGKIIFGQGNFIFAKNYAHNPLWGDGFVVIADVTKDGVKYEYVPYNKTEVGIEMTDSTEILDGLKARSQEILEPGFIEKNFVEMAEKTVYSRYVKNMLKGYMNPETTEEEFFANYKGNGLFHFAECEVHRECLLTGLRKKLGRGKWGEFKDLNK